MRKQITFISTAIVISALLISGLSLYSNHTVNQRNGFNRKFSVGKLQKMYTSNINHMAVVSLCGASPLYFYFKTSDPTIIVRTKKNLSNSEVVKLKIDLPELIISRKNFELFIDGMELTLFMGNIPSIIRGNIDSNRYSTEELPYKFHRAVVTDLHDIVVIRGFDSSKVNKQLFRYSLREHSYTDSYAESEPLNDGGLLNDGILNYDPFTGSLVYTHYYNNRIVILDRNLQVRTLSHTIDTFSQFQTAATRVKGSFTFNKPKHTLIGHATTGRGKLFVLSLLIADNEKRSSLKNQSPIDVYDDKKGTYITSIYIPHFKDKRPISFKIIDQQLIAIYTDQIVLYSLPREL